MSTPMKADMVYDTSCIDTDAKMCDIGLTSSSGQNENAIESDCVRPSRLEIKCSEIDMTSSWIED